MDSAILLAVARRRTPWLTIASVDVTALGSITLVVLFSAFTLVVLLALRDRLGALQLLGASAGAGMLTLVTKIAFFGLCEWLPSVPSLGNNRQVSIARSTDWS